jgi:perosamine synthetase
MNEKSTARMSYLRRISRETLPCYEPSVGEEEIELLSDVIRSNWLSEGKYVSLFEDQLAKICERRHGLALCNATSALIVGMRALGIGPGDEVIVPSLTHSADANAICAVGASPVFADVDKDSLCLSLASIDAVRTKKTRAILHVALYGSCGELDAIDEYAKQHKLHLINDCAPALRGNCRKKRITSYGDFAVLSFFADKTITTGEGGLLLTDNDDLLAECNIYKHDGRRERGTDLIERQGYNLRMTELQAAVGVAQVAKLETFVARKQQIHQAYAAKLASIPDCRVYEFPTYCAAVPHRVVVFVDDASALIGSLTARGIGARTLFMPLHLQPAYRQTGDFPVTSELYRTGVCLPSAPSLSIRDIDFVCASIALAQEGRAT